MSRLSHALMWLAIVGLGLPATPGLAADKPLVLEGAKIKQLPANTTLQVNASGAAAASINMPPGSAPSSPNDGDCWTTTSGLFCRINGATIGPYASGTGSVSTTGSPASGNLTKFSGAASVTNGDLSGDVTTSGTLATTIANNAVTTAKINNSAVTLAKIANAAANSKLVGSGAAGSGSAYTEITLGTNLSMSGSTLNASGGGGTTTNALTITSSGGASPGATFDGSAAKTIDYSTVGAAKTGAATGSGLTMATARLLGRTTASTGAIEEISVGTGLTLSSGTLSASGTSGSAWNLQFGPLDGEAPSSNFATLDTRNLHPTLDFDASTAESTVFTAVLPNDYSGAGITVTIYWAATSATSGNVMWQASLEADAAGSQDTDSDGFASAQAFSAAAANGTSGVLTKSSLNISNGANMDSIAAGDMFRLKITRDAANGSDTMTGDAEVMRVMIVSQ